MAARLLKACQAEEATLQHLPPGLGHSGLAVALLFRPVKKFLFQEPPCG